MNGVIVRHVEQVPAVPCPCGMSTRMITRNDTPLVNFHRTIIEHSESHYHKTTTEIYYILSGQGQMFCDDQRIDLKPGVCIYLPPGVRHQVKGHIETIIVGVPALDPDDEYFDPKTGDE